MTSLAAGVTGGMVVGLLLASGFGRRFDAGGRRNKLLARLPDGRTVVSASARALCEALDHVAIVIPARGMLLEAALSDLPVRLIRNARAKEGIGASIAVGISALKADYPQATGWLIALGDMPFIVPKTIRAIADALPTVPARCVAAATFEGRRGHPVAFSRALDEDLIQLSGDTGANRVLAASALTTVECDDPGILRDIDTREDLERVMHVGGGMKAGARRRVSTASPCAVDYTVELVDPKGHYLEVVCRIAKPSPEGQRLALPAWIPGSYMIREFARNIVEIRADCAGRRVPLIKRDKHTWEAGACDGPLVVACRIYAWDPSVRAAHVDETHAFFNGTSLFLRVFGAEHDTHAVTLKAPRGKMFRDWRVATTLQTIDAPASGFGRYAAANYDELIDHPIEMGTFLLEHFDAAGVPHEIAYTGIVPNLDAARVNADLATVCAAQIRFFSPSRERKGARGAPFDRYLFLTNVVTDGYGGLEHRASTALICSRDSLPVVGDKERSRGYRTFLGLASHEYFHSWNVKRIKPARFVPYDLDRETHTELLWIFEGFTSYYDDLFLVRTGLIDEDQYLEEVSTNIDHVQNALGHTRQSVAESSFDAWTKYYRTDENTPNAVVSYYKKGALIALCLDLFIRHESRGKASLDDVMRLLWTRWGRDFYGDESRGLAEDAFPDVVEEATGVDARREIQAWAYGTDALPLDSLLTNCGLQVRRKPRHAHASLGVRATGDDRECRIAQVDEGGPSHAAGLSAGDVLVAIDDLRATGSRLEGMLAKYRPGTTVTLRAFRGDVLQSRRLMLGTAPLVTTIIDVKKVTKAQARARAAWLAS